MHSSPLGKPGTKDTGGMSTYLRELSLALGQMGRRLDLFTAVGSAAPQITALGPGARLVTLPAGSGSEAKLDLYHHLDSFTGSVDQFRRAGKQQYDLIFSHYWLSGLAGRKLKAGWGVPHVIMFHTLGAVKNACGSGESEPALRIEAEKALVRDCDRVIVASRRENEALQRYYAAPPGKIELIPCGVNLSLFRPLPQQEARHRAGLEEEKTVLFVGRLEPVKGLELLLRAAAILHGQGCSFKLLIAGGDAPDDPAIQHYRQLALEWGIADRLFFPGPVEHSLLPFYYNAADVTV
ncbi:MAG TPA: glycosyltransferase, partial [Bacillota bacterium]|nr:glycosyltransferase [Bacillota bacterium]